MKYLRDSASQQSLLNDPQINFSFHEFLYNSHWFANPPLHFWQPPLDRSHIEVSSMSPNLHTTPSPFLAITIPTGLTVKCPAFPPNLHTIPSPDNHHPDRSDSKVSCMCPNLHTTPSPFPTITISTGLTVKWPACPQTYTQPPLHFWQSPSWQVSQ